MGGWGAPLSMTCCLTFGGGGVRRKPLGNTRPRKKRLRGRSSILSCVPPSVAASKG